MSDTRGLVERLRLYTNKEINEAADLIEELLHRSEELEQALRQATDALNRLGFPGHIFLIQQPDGNHFELNLKGR